MAGVAGLEPANAGVKVPCLTAWLHPNIAGISKTEGPERTRSGPSALTYGVGDGTRTRNTWNHNPVLYQLNYTHHRKSAETCGDTVLCLKLLRVGMPKVEAPVALQVPSEEGEPPAKPDSQLQGHTTSRHKPCSADTFLNFGTPEVEAPPALQAPSEEGEPLVKPDSQQENHTELMTTLSADTL